MTDQWAETDEWPLPRYSGDSKVPATFAPSTQITPPPTVPATETASEPENGHGHADDAQGALVERLAEAIEDGLFRMHGLTSSCNHHEEARTLLPVVAAEVEAAVSAVRAANDVQDEFFHDRLSAVQEEYMRAAESWDRQRDRLTADVRALREKVAKVEALRDEWAAGRAPTAAAELARTLSDPTTPDQTGGEGASAYACVADLDRPDWCTAHNSELTSPNRCDRSGSLGTLADSAGPPPCPNHHETRHRDRKPPWCNTCGWSHAKPGTEARQLRALDQKGGE